MTVGGDTCERFTNSLEIGYLAVQEEAACIGGGDDRGQGLLDFMNSALDKILGSFDVAR